MYLHDAQNAVERIFHRIMMKNFGVYVRYARGCRRNYIVTVNNLHGAEAEFALSLTQLLDSEKVAEKLTKAFIRLEEKESR